MDRDRIDADLVRRLTSNREGTRLEFKSEHHAENAELAKDLMALANVVGPDAPPAYMLVGVEEVQPDLTGRVVGVPGGTHPKPSDLAVKVSTWLSRQPQFTFAPVELDGSSVGVFQVKQSGRPIYAIRASGNTLIKHVAYYRDGPVTLIASPDVVLGWHREDDGRSAVELEALRAQVTPRPVLRPGGHGANGDRTELIVHLANHGNAPLTVMEVASVIRLSAEGRTRFGRALPLELSAAVGLRPHLLLKLGDEERIPVVISSEQMAELRRLLGRNDIARSDLEVEVCFVCAGPTDRQTSATSVLRFPK